MSESELPAPDYRNALPTGTVLLEYRLESVLGAGGFGMTYLARDTHLEKQVAIKEYLPGLLALRALDGSVVPVNTDSQHDYRWGLDRFILEARTLAKFSHPSIVRVNRFFEANGTGYMVMDYEAGMSLNHYLKTHPMPPEIALKKLMIPILEGLRAVHDAGFLHRDIKPSNVFIRENGTPVLLDFGSARLVGKADTGVITSIVSPGYAPLEQYTTEGRQGPWSDIYAMAAVMYRAVTGENPPDPVTRLRQDAVPPGLTAARTRYSERFLKTIEWGLALNEKIRPQSVAEWGDMLSGRAPLTAFNRGAPPVKTAMDSGVWSNAQALEGAGADALRARPLPAAGKRAGKGVWIAVVLVLAAVLAWAGWRGLRPAATPVIAPAPAPVSTPSPTILPPASAPTDTDTASPVVTSPPPSASSDIPSPPADGGMHPAQPALSAPPTTPPASSDTLPPPGGAPNKVGGAPGLREFHFLDRNGDSYLTPDEVRELPTPGRLMEAADENHDGRISMEEWQRFHARRPPPR